MPGTSLLSRSLGGPGPMLELAESSPTDASPQMPPESAFSGLSCNLPYFLLSRHSAITPFVFFVRCTCRQLRMLLPHAAGASIKFQLRCYKTTDVFLKSTKLHKPRLFLNHWAWRGKVRMEHESSKNPSVKDRRQ